MALKAAKRLIDAGVSVQRIREVDPRAEESCCPTVAAAAGRARAGRHRRRRAGLQGRHRLRRAVSGQEWVFEVARFEREVEAGSAAAPAREAAARARAAARRRARADGSCRSRRCAPSAAAGLDAPREEPQHARHRDREPEGRLREDDHRREPGRLPGRRRARACWWSTSTRRRTPRSRSASTPSASTRTSTRCSPTPAARGRLARGAASRRRRASTWRPRASCSRRSSRSSRPSRSRRARTGSRRRSRASATPTTTC